ncbi:hypothetical protein ACVIHI_008581 [Bradyrhizobium sp. USDA 4524]|nr:hypothetical protein [Bradyrhizobium sp. USDA 4538]MCP1907409.1 hypothetical protein [Bradyrhizobium sp. USDA 4537]MCP1985195.1 hypothetical protein [Bradyrhizobium sp. USDA 4539]
MVSRAINQMRLDIGEALPVVEKGGPEIAG